jgi:hypothetical protein
MVEQIFTTVKGRTMRPEHSTPQPGDESPVGPQSEPQAPRQHPVAGALKWIALGVILVEAGLVLTGLLDFDDAVLIALGLEGLCAVVAIAMAVTVRVQYRRLVAAGRSREAAFFGALGYVLPGPVVFILRHELKVFEGLWLLIRRRDNVPDGATVLRYGANVRLMLVVCGILSVIEIAVVELLVPWYWLRMVLLGLTVYGIVWVFGFLGALRRQPHYATRQELVLCFGHLHRLRVDLTAVKQIRMATQSGIKKTVLVADGAVSLTVFGGTSAVAELADGSSVDIDGRTTEGLTEIRFDVDDPSAAVTDIKRHLAKISA